MQVEGIDERRLGRERNGAAFLVFIYEGGDDVVHRGADGPWMTSWSVDSLLLTDGDLPSALRWLGENLPANCCWSLGVVVTPDEPTTETELAVSWVVGSDVLNLAPYLRSPEEQRLAEEMLARRHRVTLV